MGALLAVSLGPVQDFIATARRTRDLFAGSRLLSEAAQAAAEVLAQAVGPENLIFPAPTSPSELKELGQAGIANVLLALIPEGQDPGGLGQRAVEAARAYLVKKAQELFTAAKHAPYVEQGAALAQVGDLLEGYYAYVPLASEADYPQARGRLMALLAARKNTRNFAPVSWGKEAFKSSLDGARESVLLLPDDPKEADQVRLDLRLRRGEYLSGPDLLKRWWEAGQGFVSTTHMAALPFWEGVKAKGGEAWVREALEHLAALVGKEARASTDHPVLKDTPFVQYDVRLLYESRLEEFPALEGPGQLEAAKEILRRLWGKLRQKGIQAPPGSYYALLHADGDRMGEALDRLGHPQAHRAFSRALALGFAREVKGIVEAHGGGLVYSGGDDVLALLPLHTALRAAWALAQRFQKVMGEALEGVPLEQPPTLSVGLAVVHHLESLQDALDLARRAEKLAKEGREGEEKRNALAVAYSPRAGSELMVRGRWDEVPRLTQRLLRLADLLRLGEVPARVAYELWELAQEGEALRLPQEALMAEARRILGRKEMKRGHKEELARWLSGEGGVGRLAEELLLARPFAEALEQAAVPTERREVWDAH
ncbi:type III-B CRISPR-associated protein Cas10/Cmr2 [Thermus caliditerrae]|uniref:type III-B CRISPR-associated protein Cas10/Cmr2 n=1 Tax=Thermus caliditerrae TaxID=1330700 RepID=UPI001F1C3360|nr:type III-B CRISPR-associated protein Cas10/Cmr2 [Thermus caliditerrae]